MYTRSETVTRPWALLSPLLLIKIIAKFDFTNTVDFYSTLQNNQLKTVPNEAIRGLSGLQSL